MSETVIIHFMWSAVVCGGLFVTYRYIEKYAMIKAMELFARSTEKFGAMMLTVLKNTPHDAFLASLPGFGPGFGPAFGAAFPDSRKYTNATQAYGNSPSPEAHESYITRAISGTREGSKC